MPVCVRVNHYKCIEDPITFSDVARRTVNNTRRHQDIQVMGRQKSLSIVPGKQQQLAAQRLQMQLIRLRLRLKGDLGQRSPAIRVLADPSASLALFVGALLED